MATLRLHQGRRTYWEDKAYAPIAALGLMAVMFALAVGAVIGLYTGDLFGGQAADPEQHRGVIDAANTWKQQVQLFGAALLITSVVITLRQIVKTIRFDRGEALKTHLPTLLQRGGN